MGRHNDLPRERPSATGGSDIGRVLTAHLAVFAITCLLAWPAASATLTEHMDLACTQDDIGSLRCDYRLLDGGSLESAVAEYEGTVVQGRDTAAFPSSADTSAVMILVDTSDPARQPAIDRIIDQVDDILAALRPHHRVGLASFDTELYVMAAVGTSAADIRVAAGNLRAKGRTTELYRNVREAVRLLGQMPDSRKVLLLLSDGLAEDFAYHHQDVIDAAREYGVVIYSIGYPRSVARSVALQTVRRLSDESGGLYFQANHVDYALPEGIFPRIVDAADSGGALEFDLTPFTDAGASGAIDLSLAFQTRDQSFLVLAPVLFPGETVASPVPPPAAPSLPAPIATARQAGPAPRAPAPIPERSMWPWLFGLVALLVLILIVLFVVLRRLRSVPPPPSDLPQSKPLAWMVMDDLSASRHAIDKTPWRIGRGRNNDLVIPDNSVSRLHAEVRINEEGQLTLNDLESLNGVFVNDTRSDTIQLREGDVVDVGDIRMTFTLQDESYESQEATVLVRTHTPA